MKTHYNRLAFSIASLLSLLLLLSSCGLTNNYAKKGEVYKELYAQKPLSILVMPPINKTNKVEAKEAVYASLFHPLVERGYYVFSPILAQELLQSESAEDAELFIDGNLKPFDNVFTADAVLFTVINKWQKIVLTNTIDVNIEYILKSTKDNKILFQRSADVTVDCKVAKTSSMLLNLVANALATALSDNVVAARKSNGFVLSDIPEGKYAPLHDKDQDTPAQPKDITGRVNL